MKYEFAFEAEVLNHFAVEGYLKMKNGCCKDKPVLLTRTLGTKQPVYSCQCACGGWCTTGMFSISEAVNHYERMSNGENLYGSF